MDYEQQNAAPVLQPLRRGNEVCPYCEPWTKQEPVNMVEAQWKLMITKIWLKWKQKKTTSSILALRILAYRKNLWYTCNWEYSRRRRNFWNRSRQVECSVCLAPNNFVVVNDICCYCCLKNKNYEYCFHSKKEIDGYMDKWIKRKKGGVNGKIEISIDR